MSHAFSVTCHFCLLYAEKPVRKLLDAKNESVSALVLGPQRIRWLRAATGDSH